MQDTFTHLSAAYPLSLLQLKGFQTHYPQSTYAQGYTTSGSGSGFGYAGLCSAYGELIERNHFYLHVKSDIKNYIHETNDTAVAKSMYKMIQQIQTTSHSPQEHQFHLCEVNNIFTQKKHYLPTVLIALSFFNLHDRQYIPFIDSCGQAGHIQYEKAFHSALFEFIERQALLGSWMIRKFRYKLPKEILLENKKQKKLAQQLLENGEVYVFDLALDLPGYVVLILYFSKSTQDYVQYAIGVSASFHPQEAITKALNELWMDYNYLYISNSVKNPTAAHTSHKYYALRHIEDNNILKTKPVIAYDLQAENNISISDYFSLPAISDQQACNGLREISPHIFVYHRSDLQKEHDYVKIFSPDFLLHMSLENKLNVDNPYINRLNNSEKALYRKTIPFP